MSKLFLGKMNLSKIDKNRIFEGKQGKWIDLTVWFSDEPDQYGNHLSIQQSTKKGENKIYLGSAKLYEPQQAVKPAEDKIPGLPDVDDNIPGLPDNYPF